MDATDQSNVSMSLEFLANRPESQDRMVKVRIRNILVTSEELNLMNGVPDYTKEEEELIQEENWGMNMVKFAETVGFHGYRMNDARLMQFCELNTVAKSWCIFVSHYFRSTKNLARVE